MKKFIGFLIIMHCLITQAQTNTVKNGKWALACINALPEVKAFMKEARKNKPIVMIAEEPGPN